MTVLTSLRLNLLRLITSKSFASKFFAIGILTAVVALLRKIKARDSKLPLPPGPKGHWLYGVDLNKP